MGSPRGPRRPPWEFSWYLLFSLFFPLLGEARPGAPPGGCPFSTLTEAANHPGNRGHRCTKTQWVVSRAGSRCEPCRDAAGECARGFYWFWRAAAGRAGPWCWRSASGSVFRGVRSPRDSLSWWGLWPVHPAQCAPASQLGAEISRNTGRARAQRLVFGFLYHRCPSRWNTH